MTNQKQHNLLNEEYNYDQSKENYFKQIMSTYTCHTEALETTSACKFSYRACCGRQSLYFLVKSIPEYIEDT